MEHFPPLGQPLSVPAGQGARGSAQTAPEAWRWGSRPSSLPPTLLRARPRVHSLLTRPVG